MSPLQAQESVFGGQGSRVGLLERRTSVPFEEVDEDTASPWATWTCLAVMPTPRTGLPVSSSSLAEPIQPLLPPSSMGG